MELESIPLELTQLICMHIDEPMDEQIDRNATDSETNHCDRYVDALSRIESRLSTERASALSVLNVRLVSRRLLAGAQRVFELKFFEHRSHNIGYRGLRKLEKISRHRRLRYAIKKLTLYPYDPWESFLEESGRGVVMLRGIFRRLSNCKEVYLDDPPQAFTPIWNAIGQSNTSLAGFHMTSADALDYHALQLPGLPPYQVELSLGSLRRLTLVVAGQDGVILSQFLMQCRNLVMLDLEIEDSNKKEFATITKNVRLQHLKGLHISSMHIDSGDIRRFLSAHSTSLREVTFEWVYLYEDVWMQLLLAEPFLNTITLKKCFELVGSVIIRVNQKWKAGCQIDEKESIE